MPITATVNFEFANKPVFLDEIFEKNEVLFSDRAQMFEVGKKIRGDNIFAKIKHIVLVLLAEYNVELAKEQLAKRGLIALKKSFCGDSPCGLSPAGIDYITAKDIKDDKEFDIGFKFQRHPNERWTLDGAMVSE
jgi:hypothetical protein